MKKLHLMIAALIFNVAPLPMAHSAPTIDLNKGGASSFSHYPFDTKGGAKWLETDFSYAGGFSYAGNFSHAGNFFYAGIYETFADSYDGYGKTFTGGYDVFKPDIPSYYCDTPPVAPVPEPETWALMLLGVGLLAYQVRQRKNKSAVWSAT